MASTAPPDSVSGRLDALPHYHVLETSLDPVLDDLTSLAARICEAPIGRITLLDDGGQWSQSDFGQQDLFVADINSHEPGAANHPVSGDTDVRFYVGAALRTPGGEIIGALCVLDRVPRTLTPYQQDALRVLSRQVMAQFDLRRQARELASRERFLQAVFDSEPECVKVLGPDGSLLMMNRAGLRMIEADSFAQVAGTSIYPLVVPADRPAVRLLTERVFRGESGSLEFQAVGLKGAQIWLESNAGPLRDEQGKVAALLAVTRDISLQKQAAADLQTSQGRLDAIIQSVDGIVWEADATTMEFTFVSQRAERLLGYPRERWLQDPTFWRNHLHPDDRDWAIEVCARATAERRDHEFEYRMLAADGGIFWLRDIVTVVVEDGVPVKLRGLMVDISKQVRLEEQLRQAQKLDAVGQLAGGVAHDFNNILMAIMMQAEMAAMSPAVSSETREYLEDIKGQAQRAANLTRQLLTFSRRQVMQTQSLDVNDNVAGLAAMLQRILGEDVRLELKLHDEPLMVRADPGMFDQVLMNLVVNARDAMPNGGSLIIETGTRELAKTDPQMMPAILPGRYAVLRVTDTGTGISPENMRRIFEPFFTTKEPGKGTGLGLATVFGIVKQHFGSIQVSSEVGIGTTCEILFPIDQKAVRFGVTAKLPYVARGGSETILVVEDEPSVRALNKAVLERNGYTVLVAAHGVEALQVWEAHKGTIHLLLTDLVMPEGISGRDLAAQLQQRSTGLKVIFTSGYSAEAAGIGFDLQVGRNFLQKPSTLRQLLDTVRDCLDGNDTDCLEPGVASGGATDPIPDTVSRAG